jgi:hypothetical protein
VSCPAVGSLGPGEEREDGAPAGPDEWADRFVQQSQACGHLGSRLYERLLALIADDVRRGGPSWDVVATRAGLRFGQAGPLRLVGTAHRLALAGDDAGWAAVLPSCGGTVPTGDAELRAAWLALLGRRSAELAAGLDHEVQTNEVGRAAGLALAIGGADLPDGTHLVELGCSGGLNLRLDRFDVRLGGRSLGTPGAPVVVQPEVRGDVPAGLRLPAVAARLGLDPHPVDPTTEDGRLTLMSYLWPDQPDRLARTGAAVDVARAAPAELRRVQDTAAALAEVLAGRSGPVVVQHSIVWQYVPTAQRWGVTSTLEAAGREATADHPLAWVRYEPDEWDRRRAAVWLRRWPGGADRLVAHVDFHGRWIAPVPR